ncbi:DUF2785 domain-containing protein [Vallitalea pronyensis]|uniref:DUF2785 domain-containing protein n=1 Tax=Vallitalea pronyensis TaxID=1348613 RepID=A0A8J8MKC0_9FIRM|nr:DUF2785 domain-containing protein [Vallitalea pronyensis]QUI23285.1 DUF2785 domain-containing protein [Vallitalea pronyensis]
MNETTLKELLQQMKLREWTLLDNMDPNTFVLHIMKHIGSTDPELRDHLILPCLLTIIERKALTNKQLIALLDLCLSKDHLFYEHGLAENDGVFNRSFTVLIIGGILNYHLTHNQQLLSQELVIHVYTSLVNYIENEKDTRGYDPVKGWADATGHWALTFDYLMECSSIGGIQLKESLDLTKRLVCHNKLVFINNEDDRFTTVVVNIIERDIICEADLIQWISSFETITLAKDYLDRYKLCVNRKNFLMSLYFRLSHKNRVKLCKEIEKVIFSINPYIV